MSVMKGRFTGWHATACLVVFFGVVAVVNFTMAAMARSAFPGTVVENSYVASQEFNGWLEQARASDRLGWELQLTWLPDGRISVGLKGAPAGARLSGMARHPLGRFGDTRLTFGKQASGRYLSNERLPDGRWTVRLEAHTGDVVWREEAHLQ